MFRNILISHIVLTSCSTLPVQSIKCYQCKGDVPGDCDTNPAKYLIECPNESIHTIADGYPPRERDVVVKQLSMFYGGVIIAVNYCAKIVLSHQNRKVIMRSCSASDHTRTCDRALRFFESGLRIAGLKVDSCDFCGSDHCNSSHTLTCSSLSILITLIIICKM